MPICGPCQPTHTPVDCDDTVHGRTGIERRCYCQHKPRATAPTGQATPGPECEIPTEPTEHARSVGALDHTDTGLVLVLDDHTTGGTPS